MFLPLGDTPNPPSTPIVNYLLIGLNVAVFLGVSLPLMNMRPDLSDPALLDYLRSLGLHGSIAARDLLQHLSAYDLAVFKYGFRPADPSLLTLFTAMFMHGGWLHLIGNMLFLWIFGDNVEHRLGHVKYLLAYLGTGVAATLFFALFVPGSQVPLVGASGAISGVLGFYFLWFPRNKVKTFVFLFPFIMTTFMIPARYVLGFFLLVDNLLPFLLARGGAGGVAHGAHIGGFLAGLGFAWWSDRLTVAVKAWHTRSEAEEETAAPPPELSEREAIRQALEAGRLRRAAGLYFSLSGRQERLGVPAGDVLAIGRYLHSEGYWDEALTLYRRFISERPADPQLDQAYLGAGKALMHKPRCITSAYHYFLNALDAARSRELADEVRLHLHAIEQLGKKSS